MMLAVAVKMQAARDQFLAGPTFALNQNRAVGVGNLVNQAINELHFLARSNDVLKFVFILELLAEVNVLPQGRLVIQSPLHRHLQFGYLERLGHVIVSAHLHRFDRGFHRGISGDQNHRGLPEMLADVAEDVESRHRFHPDIGNDDVRLNRIHLFDRFWRGIERENLMTLFPAKCHDDFDHCRLVIDDYDLSHSQRGEYFSFEKKKEETRENLISVGDFTMEHDPWNLADKIENCLVNGGRVSKRYTDHICQKILAYFSKLIFSPQRPRRINRHHLQSFLRLKSRKLFMKRSHFREQAKIIVAG